MNIKKREIVKAGVGIVVSAGVGIIAQNALVRFVPENMNLPRKIAVAVGGAALIGVVTTAASSYTDDIIDAFMSGVDEAFIRRHKGGIIEGAEEMLKDDGGDPKDE